jgi:lysozyme
MKKKAIELAKSLLVEPSEGCRLKAYYCPAKILTIGWGTTGSWITPHMKITQEQADDLVIKELIRNADAVERNTNVPLTINQYAALIDFIYNLGAGCYQRSSVRMRINRYDYDGGASVLLRYVYGGGKILPGLVKRRQAEYKLFMSKWQ